MSHPHSQHRREIWSSLCIGYDTVSGLLWQQARGCPQGRPQAYPQEGA